MSGGDSKTSYSGGQWVVHVSMVGLADSGTGVWEGSAEFAFAFTYGVYELVEGVELVL